MGASVDEFEDWFDALERRHLASLTFAEVRRALEALSAVYVERRARLGEGAALSGAGKRAAFALFYGPLHYLAIRDVVVGLDAAEPGPARILDLGCGSGASGASWAVAAGRRPELSGVDAHPWAVAETRWCWNRLGVRGTVRRSRLERVRLPGAGSAILLAYTVNELVDEARSDLLGRLLEAAGRGAAVLVVEPIAKRAVPWWGAWAARFVEAGGREDLWRRPVDLPPRLRLLDRAAGLHHREITARTLHLAGK